MNESVTSPGEPERWLPAPGYEGLYEVSDMGRVRRVWKRHYKMLAPITAKGAIHSRVHLCREGVRRKVFVHVLVARAFLGPRPEGMQVCHGPGGSRDNRLVNLSYGSPSKNNGEDRWRDGTIPAGVRCSTAKLTDAIVLEIRARAAAGETNPALGREFGVGASSISKIVQGLTWRHVAGPLTVKRVPRGERQWAARLTEADVRDIRARYAQRSDTALELARAYGVAKASILRAVNRETWKHVA